MKRKKNKKKIKKQKKEEELTAAVRKCGDGGVCDHGILRVGGRRRLDACMRGVGVRLRVGVQRRKGERSARCSIRRREARRKK